MKLAIVFIFAFALAPMGQAQSLQRKRPRWAVLTGMVFGQVSIKKSSGHIRRYEGKSQGALISSV